jgi:hypothetical protein
LQEGIADEDARRIGEDAGLTVIMGLCIKKQQQRLQGGFGGVVEPKASEAPESKGGSGA